MSSVTNAEMIAWMAKAPQEDVIEPGLPIIDAHHHLWDRSAAPSHKGPPRQRVWMLPEVLAEVHESGHNIVKTVYVQAGSFHHTSGAEEMKPVGETEVVQGLASMCNSGLVVGAAIVGTADLRHPNIEAVLSAHMRSKNFVGIRMQRRIHPPVPYSADDVDFHRGFAMLEKYGLSFDCWLTSKLERDFASVPRVTALAQAYPKVTIVLNHLGCPVGPTMGTAAFDRWKQDLAELAAACPNVVCKLGGIQMPVNDFGLEKRAVPIGSEELFKLTFPYYSHAVECFGPRRCMFESNFPVDKDCVSYRVLWNCFKRVAAAMGFSAEDKREIFHDTAARVYKLPLLDRSTSKL